MSKLGRIIGLCVRYWRSSVGGISVWVGRMSRWLSELGYRLIVTGL
jgi:hypothetical protein